MECIYKKLVSALFMVRAAHYRLGQSSPSLNIVVNEEAYQMLCANKEFAYNNPDANKTVAGYPVRIVKSQTVFFTIEETLQ
jgi:hypothetical protein